MAPMSDPAGGHFSRPPSEKGRSLLEIVRKAIDFTERAADRDRSVPSAHRSERAFPRFFRGAENHLRKRQTTRRRKREGAPQELNLRVVENEGFPGFGIDQNFVNERDGVALPTVQVGPNG
jgi:hypothetical protein